MIQIDFPSEKVIEDYIYKSLYEDGVCPISGEFFDLCFRQHQISSYGIPDIIKIQASFDGIQVVILELKNVPLKENHLTQLCRYIAGAKKLACRYERLFPGCPEISVRGELAGPYDPTESDMVWLLELVDDVSVYSLNLDIGKGFSSSLVGKGWSYSSEQKKAKPSLIRLISGKVSESTDEEFGPLRLVTKSAGGK
jgi:hypothetical protein